MAITSIKRDWGVEPAIVRITATDDLATITTVGYLATQLDEIEAVNAGPFEWAASDYVLCYYDSGTAWDFFVRVPATDSLVAAADVPGSLSETLASGQVFVGNASNVATAVPLTGPIAISNTGLTSIVNGTVVLADLAAGITPAYVVKYAGKDVSAGGSATVTITATGVAATDVCFAQIQASVNAVTIQKVTPTTNTITVLCSADPGAATIAYQALRAAS
jgi:hypothetical protein